MTLEDYYLALEKETPPKTAFVKDVAAECGVEIATVRTWILYGRKPSEARFVDILVAKTGIPANELWADESN